MKNRMFTKFFTTMMATVMITSTATQTFAKEPSLNDKKAIDVNVVDTKLIGQIPMNSTEKHVITLITGDVVTVTGLASGKSVISVESADGTDEGVRIMTLGKDTYVIPNQAMSHLASGLLDKDLFNITALIANGYDDVNQSTLPVIVQYASTKAKFESTLPATLSGSERTNILESISGVAVSADKEQVKEFWNDIRLQAVSSPTGKSQLKGGIEKVWLDGRVEATLAESVPQIGAPEAWSAGYDGTGVKVAVLDTGIDAKHPDVADQIKVVKSFIPGEEATDHHGHGTHVASTVLGTGAASDGFNKGVAPGANLLVGKVLSKDGFGLDSWVIEGMEWASENADIVNMSLGDPQPSDGTDPMSQAVNRLSEETGALFVIAAGNSGMEGIGSPGAADAALTVGAVDKSDKLAWYSTKGPRFMNGGLKPDLVAPGSDIVAARAQLATGGSGYYQSMDGTSMATPHVAGAAAILLQRNPNWTGEQLKTALMSTTKKLDHIKPFEGGTGRVDIAAATSATVFATGSVDFGFFNWPHDDHEKVEKTVTYTNESEESVTLDLSATFTDSSGSAAPEGLLTLTATEVEVPANGSADVTVMLDPEFAALGNRYQGHLSAEVDSQTIAHTAMVMGKEEERHSLTINATDRDGSPSEAVISIIGPNNSPNFLTVNGTTELRLPPGIYSVLTLMDVDVDTDHAGVALLGNPEINLNGSKTVELDARKALEIEANVVEKTEASFRKMEYYRSFGEENIANGKYLIPPTVDKLYAEPTLVVESGVFEMNTRWRLTKPFLTINFDGNELDYLSQLGSKLLEGKHQLTAVYAGKGAPQDYNGLDVKGKVVLVDRSDKITGSKRAAAAHAAGAKLVITVNDGPKELLEWVGKEDYKTDSDIAVASVSRKDGEALIKAARSGELLLKVEGTPNTPYVYDLVDSHKRAIPEDLTYSPSESELVKIDAQYTSDRPVAGDEYRWDIPSYSDHGVGYPIEMAFPSVRTEWVSASEDTIWYHQANMTNEWQVRQPAVIYKPGQRLNEKWFAPVVRPRFGDGFWVPERFADDLQFNVQVLADSGDGHTGMDLSESGKQTLKLFQGDRLIDQSRGDVLLADGVSNVRTQFRLVSDASRDAERWTTSTSTHTEWTFWSQRQEEFHTFLPMVSLDYSVDTDMNGNTVAGDTIKLGLSASQIDYASGNGEIAGASLEVSFNEGDSWEKVELVQKGEGWTADIKNPKKSGSFVSLKASAWDDEGNRIDQEVIKAFGVSDADVSLSVDKQDYRVMQGSTEQIKVTEVTTVDGEVTEIDVTDKAAYEVEDETVASVTNGLITAKAKGSTKVTISYGGKEVAVNVTVAESDTSTISAVSIKSLVERFEKEGEFKNATAARALKTHLSAVVLYEKQEAAEKVVKHMKSFKVLLDHQLENKLISEKAYNALKADTDVLIQKWQ
ncbi:S8 family serine peptidase [Sporosarcina sp. NPDC096371]|uniref:S8 family serine peptidase n=1 Tax=Sporosarcina sp. NPDC096371 TaxID=3364530 RepID=UPI00380338FB